MKFDKSPPWLIELFTQATAALPGEARKMFGYHSRFLDGNLYSGLFGATLFVRLGEADRARLLAVPGAAPFDPMGGRPMKEYVVLPRELLDDDRALRDWLDRAADYARSLPVKKASKSRASSRKPKVESRKSKSR